MATGAKKLLVVLFFVGCFQKSVSNGNARASLKRDLIVGGNETAPGSFPFMASLTAAKQHKCGATLIAPDVLLTAAHCTQNIGEVQLSRYNLSDAIEEYQSFVIQNIRTHPRYFFHTTTSGFDVDPYDVALLKIFGTSTETVVEIDRDSNFLAADDNLHAVGWGTTDPEDPNEFSEVLREASLKYISNSECIEATGNTSNGVFIDYASQIIDVSLCAADFEGGTAACTGDSGGPLLKDGIQVGIISASFGCSHPSLPSLNVRIAHISEWIDKQVCELSEFPPDSFGCPELERIVLGPEEDGVQLSILLDLDQQPEERGWFLQLVDSTGRLRRYAEGPVFSYSSEQPLSTVTTTLRVHNNQEYVLVVLDSYGDGKGFLSISSIDETVLCRLEGEYRYFQTCPFIVGSIPSPLPTAWQPTSAPTSARPFLTILIQLDDSPSETGFFVEALSDGSERLIEAVYPGTFGEGAGNTVVIRTIYLLPFSQKPQLYRFTMTDNEHDGLSPGFYKVWLGPQDEGTLLFQGSNFFLEDTHTFEVAGEEPTPAPSGHSSSSLIAVYRKVFIIIVIAIVVQFFS